MDRSTDLVVLEGWNVVKTNGNESLEELQRRNDIRAVVQDLKVPQVRSEQVVGALRAAICLPSKPNTTIVLAIVGY